ncbi:winged helix-turn-helix transcriptional regulator [Micromonospora endophytica]|uniref:winged helix-turn-helix transcriptional regulator n=1 Tax=Micromonospora endophytica TaxID=515350 RepID=UPI0015E8E84D|nr:helix-turn-helix domain-containing protein [Micromonospora endophytica]BCJ62906.1 hypothetical protein Jiend_63280 [Micromonospora endophytica]
MGGSAEQVDEQTADCQARLAFEVLANRWDSVVIFTIAAYGPSRPALLRTRIGGISAKVLHQALRRLEHNGLVQRRPYREAPPRVDYALTEAGQALLEPMRMMGAWATQYADAVLDAQERSTAASTTDRTGRLNSAVDVPSPG